MVRWISQYFQENIVKNNSFFKQHFVRWLKYFEHRCQINTQSVLSNQNTECLNLDFLEFIPWSPTDNKPSLVLMMAGIEQVTSHCLNLWLMETVTHWCSLRINALTHWGWEMHTCFSELSIIGSDNGLSPGHQQAIICTNAGILLIGPLEKISMKS